LRLAGADLTMPTMATPPAPAPDDRPDPWRDLPGDETGDQRPDPWAGLDDDDEDDRPDPWKDLPGDQPPPPAEADDAPAGP